MSLVLQGTAVKIKAVYHTWAEIDWTDADSVQRGWVLLKWIDLRELVHLIWSCSQLIDFE